MPTLALLCYSLSLLLTAGVTFRLAGLARRTGEAPERLLALASGCLTLAAVTDGLGVLPAIGPSTSARVSHALYCAAAAAMAQATARVFHPGVLRTRTAVQGLLAVLGGIGIWLLFEPHLDASGRMRSGGPARAYLVGLGVRAAIYGWLSFEAGRHFAALRKGLRFGLSDPLVTLQFLAWSGASICMGIGVVGALWTRVTVGVGIVQTEGGQYFFAVLAFLSGLFMWLTFVPPRALARRIRARWEPGDE